MSRFIFGRCTPRATGVILATFAILSGAEAGSEAESPRSQLHAEIEKLLKLGRDSLATEEEGVKTFSRIEELAQRLVEVGDFETAGALAAKGVELFPQERRSLVLLGWTQGLSGEYDRAVALTRTALDTGAERLPDPDDSSLINGATNLGGFLIHQGEIEEAVEILEKAVRAGSDRAAVQYLLGQAYFELGEHFLSAKAYERALRNPLQLATPEDYFRYVSALDGMGKFDKAAKALQKGIRDLPNASGLYMNWGLNAEARNATREAYLHYRMETEVSGPDSFFTRAALKRIERIERLQATSTFSDTRLQSLIAFLDLTSKAEDPEKTEDVSRDRLDGAYAPIAREDGTEHPYLSLIEAAHLRLSERTEEAIEVLESARAQSPDQVVFILELAKLYGQTGDTSKSNALIRDALLLAPDHWKVARVVGPLGAPQ